MFCDIKLSIHYGEEKTKSILLETKLKSKKAGKINIAYQEIDIKKNLKLLTLFVYQMKQCLVYPRRTKQSKTFCLEKQNTFGSTFTADLMHHIDIKPRFDYPNY